MSEFFKNTGRIVDPDFDGSRELEELYSLRGKTVLSIDEIRISADDLEDWEILAFLKFGIIPKSIRSGSF